ncbi:MAG: alanine racemase [Lawsonibacter sp.]|nr:alanine racemase [Lawsonibacter sp.]
MRRARTWAEIDLDALAHNCHTLRQLAISPFCPQPRFLGLVKANAYGHGAVPVAKKLASLGVDMLAVACLAEAAELREAGVSLPILCLGMTPPELAPELLAYDVTQTVGDLETGRALSAAAVAAGKTLKIHVKLDTGMGRLGFVYCTDDDEAALERVAGEIAALCALPGLEAEGIFTHFANADGSQAYTHRQTDRFQDVLGELHDLGLDAISIHHCAASAAVLNCPWTAAGANMIRPGIALYGYVPDPSVEDPGLRPVMTVKSRIAAVRDLPAGSFISYGCTARLARDSRLAVVPVGYGDGYPRSMSNRMKMLVHGMPCPVVGRVCMDMCMVDVTDIPGVQAGDTATVYGPGLTQRAAELDGTIVYELLCQISPRVPRVYLEQGREIGGRTGSNPPDSP